MLSLRLVLDPDVWEFCARHGAVGQMMGGLQNGTTCLQQILEYDPNQVEQGFFPHITSSSNSLFGNLATVYTTPITNPQP